MKSVIKIRNSVRRTIVSILAVALIALPALPVINAAIGDADSTSSYVTLDKFSGHGAINLTVSGGNFLHNETVQVVAKQNDAAIASTTTVATANGEFTATIALPVKLAQGPVAIVATGQTSGLTSTNSYYATPFTPSLQVSATDTTPYGSLTVSGSGYAPNEVVDLNFAGSTTTATADANGSFKNAIVVTPVVPAASYTLIGVGETSGASDTAYEYVNGFYPSAAPSIYYVMPAAQLGFNGSGFAPNETVTVTDADSAAQLSSFTTDAKGAFKNEGNFTVPASYAGQTKKFVLTGAKSNASTTTSTGIGQYYPSVSPTSYYVLPGKTFAFNGSGFVPGETINVTLGKVSLGTINADEDGNLVAAGELTVPAVLAGSNLTFVLTGETSHGVGSVSVQIGSYSPQASPSSYYVKPGANISFSGSGYAPGEVVAVLNGETIVDHFNADETGSFTQAGNIMVAYNQANSSVAYSIVGVTSLKPIDVSIGVGQLDTQLSPSSYYVLPYQAFDVVATGFAPNESVVLKNGTAVVGTAVTNAAGKATFKNVSLPYSGLSSAALVATGATSNATANVTIGIGSYSASITASNYYAKPGTTVTLTGSGFAPNEEVTITAGALTQQAKADADGALTTDVVLPFGQTKNSLGITATGQDSHATSDTTITLAPYTPQVSPSTYYAQPGTPISFTGNDFLPGESVSVSLNGTPLGTETIDAKGKLASTGTYTLPFGKAASFVATGLTSGGSATMNIGLAQFYAGIQLDNYYGNGGSTVTASGSGFAPNETITLSSGTITLATTTATAAGAFSQTVTVPYAKPGNLAITANGAQSQATASTGFTVAQAYNSVGLGSYAVPAGKAVTITGSGFFAGEPVKVTANRGSIAYSFTATATGTLNDKGLVLPADLAEGMLTLTITGGYSYTTHDITFYVQNANAQ